MIKFMSVHFSKGVANKHTEKMLNTISPQENAK